jgi:hypothetical protein
MTTKVREFMHRYVFWSMIVDMLGFIMLILFMLDRWVLSVFLYH